jgi:ribulose-5-phosphate 4-epimerase/fuculose-1-phosphate aldolase
MPNKPVANASKAAIKQLREKLILANQALEFLKMATPFGHVSVRIPGTETFLITRAVAPAMATMEDIVVCDMNGNVLEGKYTSTYSEVAVHTGVYKKRKEFNSVIHSHSTYVAALSVANLTVLPTSLNSNLVGRKPIGLYKKVVTIDRQTFGEEVADLLGPNKAVILKGHGAVCVGNSIEEALFVARNLETAAMLQWMGSCVGKVIPLTAQEIVQLNETRKWRNQPLMAEDREWKYYEHVLTKGSRNK